jgi:predicted PhzF superfamily epimerase YddE/YHI9
MRAAIHYIDTFTEQAFGGNPAAVCVLPIWPDDVVLGSLAAELNLSVTAFLVCDGPVTHLRLFTPDAEIGPAGHATMAAAHVVLRELAPQADRVVFRLRAFEPLPAMRDGSRVALDYPSMPGTPVTPPGDLIDGLAIEPREVLVAPFGYVAVVDNEDIVRSLDPKMGPLMGLDRGSTIVTAPGRTCDFVSRVFSPKLGLPEDPVCGTAHRILVPYWAERLGRHELRAVQISKRQGDFWCRNRPGRTILSGYSRSLFSANLDLPDTAIAMPVTGGRARNEEE